METIVSNNVATGSNAVSESVPVAVSSTTTTTISPTPANASNKVASYSLPASPVSSPSPSASTSVPTSPLPSPINGHHSHHNQRTPSPAPVSGVVAAHGSQYQQHVSSSSSSSSSTSSAPSSPSSPASTYSPTALLCTPVKPNATRTYHQQQELQQSPETIMLSLREKLRSPGGVGSAVGGLDLHSMLLEMGLAKPPNIIKERYLVTSHRYHMSAAAAAKTPASYRHLIDLTSSHLRCTDIFTGQQYLCKIINEPLHKVQRAYFQLLQLDAENCSSSIYGHSLIRGAHDIVPLNEQRTYVIISPPPPPTPAAVSPVPTTPTATTNSSSEELMENANNNAVDYHYEDLHTYLRNKRRLCEPEARALFHQICQTVQVCHRNGVILRDLKLRRFHFIDEARTKLQYESLEGSMILDDPADDTLREKIGCPLYTAPELLCPNATYRGKPADMWSLGVLLYTMLVGQYPFYEKANYCSLITVIRHCQVQIPSMLSRSVRWLLLALLRKNHEERMRAEHILFSPWLREQRPYYMYIPANVSIPMDDDDIEEDKDVNDNDELEENCLLSEHECESEVVMATESSLPSSSSSSSSTSRTSPSSSHRTRTIAEPLDYTCATLQFGRHQPSAGDNNRNNNNDGDNDVDMG